MNKRLNSLKTSHKEYLEKLIKQNRVPSSLLFAGAKSDKEIVAEQFAKTLVATDQELHPDIHRFRPEGKVGMHSVESIRLLKEEAYLPPFQAKRKAFLIYDAERMLPYSANALLKIFEEPPLYNTIILLSAFPEKLLPTILSRCHTIRFQGELANKMHVNATLLDLLVRRKYLKYPELLQGLKQLLSEIEIVEEKQEEAKALTAFQQQQLEKQKEGSATLQQLFSAENLFEQILAWFRDMHLLQCNGSTHLCYHQDYLDEVKQACQRGEFIPIEKVQKIIAHAKLSLERSTPVQHVFEHLFLSL